MNAANTSRQSPRRSLWKALVLCLLAVAVAAGFLLSETARAQDVPEGPGYVDLIMLYEQAPEGDRLKVAYRVQNIGTAPASGVTVSFLFENLQIAISDEAKVKSVRTVNDYNQRFTWEVGTLHPGETSQVLLLSPRIHSTHRSELMAVPSDWPGMSGVINAVASTVSPEPDMLLANNVIKFYEFIPSLHFVKHIRDNRLALMLSVDEMRPDPGDDVILGLTARNRARGEALVSEWRRVVVDPEVRVELSDGLEFKAGWMPPAEFVISDSKLATWHAPTTDTTATIPDIFPSLGKIEIQTQLTSDTLAEIPREERCITVSLEDSFPPPDPNYPLGSLRECLGDDPPLVLEEGPVAILTSFPCIDDTHTDAHQCESVPGVAIAARLPSRHEDYVETEEIYDYLRSRGVGRTDQFRSGSRRDLTVFLDPESVIIQVKDPEGRVQDSHAHSLSDVSWQTARKAITGKNPAVDGVTITYTRKDIKSASAWNFFGPRTLTVSRADGTTPGKVKIRLYGSGNQFFDFSTTNTVTKSANPLNTANTLVVRYFAEFETLGTYYIDYDLTLTDSGGASYTDTARYTFHVGPIAELAVMDGDSPLAAAGQTAYTIHAANNGPDTASAALVTLTNVPEGSEAILTDGTYRELTETCAGGLCEAEWDLGELPVSSLRPARGQTAFPTLTLIAPAGANTPDITATIANVEDYEKCIDGDGNDVPVTGADAAARKAACEATSGNSWHSAPYFDYIDDNNAATIVARAGAGGGAPGTPRSLSVLTYADPPIAVVTWGPVESVNGWPVSDYELWTARGEETCRKPRADQAGEEVTGRVHLDYSINPNELTCYYVRAVNTQEVPGYWSEPALTLAGVSDLTQLTVQGGAGVVEGGDAQFTISASPAPAAGDTLQVHYTVSQRGNFVAGLDLGQDSVIIDSRGRADITVPTEADDTGEADGAVVLTLLSGSGYALSSARSASVAVADDDDPTVSFAEPAAGVVKENAGPHNVVIQVEPAPHEDFPIGYTTEGDAVAGAGVNGDYTISGSSTGSGTVMARAGQTSVVIPVQPTDNGHSEPDESLILWLSQGDGYALGSLQVYSLTIADDDGPRAEFARAESGVDEDGGTHDVVINLDPSPAGNVSINYRLGGPATRDVDYSITGVTGSTGSVSASAGDSRVTIPVNITDDSLTEGDERLELTLLPSSDYNLGTQRTHALAIRDNDLPRVSFAAATSNPVEGVGEHPVTVRLDQPAPPDGFTLRYGVGGASTATRNRDYSVPNTRTVPEGATSIAIPVDITDDGDNEPDETVVLTLRAGSGYAVGDPSEHTLTIADDDPPLVAFAAASASVSERGGAHRATILLEPGPHAKITVRYTVDGTATEGDDFTISDCGGDPCTAMVGQGQGRAAVPITILNDGDAEGDETVVLTLLSGDGYDLALPVRYELTIKDDDAPVATFTAASGEVAEGDSGSPHSVKVKLDRPAPAGGTLLTFSVSSPPNIGATSSDDYGVPATLTARVQAGDSSTDIPVTIVGDGDNEADEVLVLTLEPGRGYSVGSADEYTLTIVDDDHDENTPVASLNNPNFHGTGATQLEWWEDGGAARPTWHVTGNFTGDVIFQYVGGTATLHEDFTVERIQGQTIEKAGDVFTVRSLESPQDFDRDTGVRWARFIFVPIRDDRAEGRETAIFRVLNGPGYTVGEPTELTIIIKD